MRNAIVLTLLYLTGFALFVISKMFGGFGPWFLFGAFIFFILYETIAMVSRRRTFQVTRKISAKRVHAGTDIDVTLIIALQESPWLPVQWLRVEDDVAQKLAVRMNRTSWMVFPWRSREAKVEYTAKHVIRGVYRFASVHITGGDMFGLLTWTVSIPAVSQLIVYPETYPLITWNKSLQVQQGNRSAQGRATDDATKVVGVRDYVAGDRLSRIHWPASARTGELRSKEFEHYVTNDVVFALDARFGETQQEDFELMLSTLASLLQYMYHATMSFGLLSFGSTCTEFPVSKGDVGFLQVMEHLAMVEGTRRSQFSEEFWRFMTLPRQTAVVLVTDMINDDLLRLAVIAKQRQQHFDVFFTRTESIEESSQATIARLRTFGWRIYEVYALSDLDAVTAGGMISGAHFIRS